MSCNRYASASKSSFKRFRCCRLNVRVRKTPPRLAPETAASATFPLLYLSFSNCRRATGKTTITTLLLGVTTTGRTMGGCRRCVSTRDSDVSYKISRTARNYSCLPFITISRIYPASRKVSSPPSKCLKPDPASPSFSAFPPSRDPSKVISLVGIFFF